jgi:methylmalonyl-CoA mutase N-terminal domain/subunit
VLKVDPATEEGQILALELHRASRDDDAVDEALAAVKAAAEGEANLLYPMRDALRLGATLGEVSTTLESVFGRYQP